MFINLILLGSVALLVGWAVATYNGLVTARNAYRNAFAQVGVQLQRRFDLIPNLVETARAYLRHERETLEAVTAARGTAMAGLASARTHPGEAAAMADLAAAQGRFEGALGRLLAVSEAYPELKADRTMMQLTEELSSTENRLAFARQAYNDAVMAYNNRREVFPASLIAGNFRFLPAAPLDLAGVGSEAGQVPRVTF